MAGNGGNKAHWENVFATKAENEVSWFQPHPKISLELFEQANIPLDANIIDMGAGDSHLVDAWLEKGYKNIYVLDISANALERAKRRLGPKAASVRWIVSDVIDFVPRVPFQFWHDRAAFHFLTAQDAINRYVHMAEKAIAPGGHLVLGTFSQNGPGKCSGLEVNRYTEASMESLFRQSFEKLTCTAQDHATPFGTTQNFLFGSFRKVQPGIIKI